jgi:hypothetical protein
MRGESPMAVAPEKYASLPAVPEPVIVPTGAAVHTPPVTTPLDSVAVFQYPEHAADEIPVKAFCFRPIAVVTVERSSADVGTGPTMVVAFPTEVTGPVRLAFVTTVAA